MKLLLFCFLLSLYPTYSFGRTVTFVVEGADGKNAKSVRQIITDHLSENYTLGDLQKVLDLIYKTGLYSDAQVDIDDHGEKTDVIFKVTLLRTIKSIRFNGNKAFGSLDLQAELGFTEGEGYSAEKVKSGVENIKKLYNLNGYPNAKISGEFSALGSSLDFNLEIKIEEGSPCVIEDIAFRSANGRLNRLLEKFVQSNKGKIFSQTLLTQLQGNLSAYLFKERYYGTTLQPPEITYDGQKSKVDLTYVLSDPYIFAMVFSGNVNVTEAQILKALNLEPENRLSNNPVEDLSDRIVRFYKKMGYASIELTHKENLFTQDYVRRLTFNINEGAKVRIKDIHIEGSFSRPDKYYRDFLYDRLGDIISGHVYDGDAFETATKNLVTEMQNTGFISAKVQGSRVDFDKRKETVIVTVILDEGPQTFIDQIHFVGTKQISNGELEKTIGINAGAPLQLNAVEESVNRIITLYRSLGYLDATVTNQGKSIISYSAENTKATLTYSIVEGPQIVVRAVLIEGNTFTKEEIIRRELQFHPGDVLTPEKLSYSEQKLQRLSFLSGIDIHPLDDDDASNGHRTVLVHVDERPPGLFKSGLGINNDLGLTIKGFAGAAYRNLFGTGRGINFRAELADKTQYNFLEEALTLGYTEPFVFNTENTGRINLTRSRAIYYIDSVTAGGPYTYAVDNSQVDTILERDLSQRLHLLYEFYGIDHLNIFEINNLQPSTPLDIATTGPTFIYDRRDDAFNPKTGDITTLNEEFSSPYLGSTATVSYIKNVLTYIRYIPLWGMVLANEAKGGYIKNLSTLNDGAIPAIKGFILGGQTTLRAFDPTTESVPLPTDFPKINGIYAAPTETFMLLAKEELRFPIHGNFGGAVFYDGGTVGFPGYHPHYFWRDDVGVGLRYNTPVGPVSLEYAYKLNRDVDRNGESVGQFLFSIGVF